MMKRSRLLHRLTNRMLSPRLQGQLASAGAALLVAAGCGASGNGRFDEQPDLSVSTPADLAPAPDLAPPADSYPKGPYGPDPGQVVPNFVFQGYFAPKRTTGTAKEEVYGEVSFDALRKSGARYALIELAGFW